MTVLIWSAVLLYFYASSRINNYLAPDFRPFVLVGGLGLAVLGGFTLLTARNVVGCGHQHALDDVLHEDDEDAMNPWLILMCMVLPLVISLAWTKDKYSPAALARKGLYDTPSAMNAPFIAASIPTLTLQDVENTHRRTPDGFLEFNLLELFFSTGDPEVQKLIEGLQVETEGRIIDEKVRNPENKRMRLYRLFINCCAADARAVPIALHFDGSLPDFPLNSWIKVAGTIRYLLEEGEIHPVLFVERIAESEPPYEESFMRQ